MYNSHQLLINNRYTCALRPNEDQWQQSAICSRVNVVDPGAVRTGAVLYFAVLFEVVRGLNKDLCNRLSRCSRRLFSSALTRLVLNSDLLFSCAYAKAESAEQRGFSCLSAASQ